MSHCESVWCLLAVLGAARRDGSRRRRCRRRCEEEMRNRCSRRVYDNASAFARRSLPKSSVTLPLALPCIATYCIDVLMAAQSLVQFKAVTVKFYWRHGIFPIVYALCPVKK